MAETQPQDQRRPESNRNVAISYARGVAGGLLVGMPLLMTMEMWWHGFYMDPWKLLLFMVFNLGVLYILEYYSGFRDEGGTGEVLQDAVIAFGIGFLVSAPLLFIFDLLDPGMSLQEIAGKIIIEAIPISIGVSVAMSQLGQQSEEAQRKKRETGYLGELGLGVAGAVLFGFNIAPTEETIMMGLMLEWWHALLVMAVSVVMVHGVVYGVDFKGSHPIEEGQTWWGVLLKYSVVQYVLALFTAAFLLWIFGRIGMHTALLPTLSMTVTLGFVTALGSAAARILI